jgi:hypothetical protein
MVTALPDLHHHQYDSGVIYEPLDHRLPFAVPMLLGLA